MTIIHYTAKVKESRLLELPEAAQELDLQPGEEVSVSVDRDVAPNTGAFPPNERGLRAMHEITQRQKNRPFSDSADSMRLLWDARSGAMYGYEPSDK